MDEQTRKDLALIVGSLSDDEDDNDAQQDILVSMSTVDVTGSLGVWGITH